MSIHPTALIDRTARLGKNVSVGAYTLIGPKVEVGDHSNIGPHVLLERNTRLGAQTLVCKGAALGVDPQDFKYGGGETALSVGARAVFREHCTVSRGSGGDTLIGDDFVLMSYASVSHDCNIGRGVVLSNAVTLMGGVTVGDHALIGGLTYVSRFCRIGRLSFVGGGFRVARDVPPFVVAGDEPLRITGINEVALKKRQIPEASTGAVIGAYKAIHAGRNDLARAIEKIRTEFGAAPEVREIIEFVTQSEKGII